MMVRPITHQFAIFDLADRAATDAALEAVIADGVPDVLVNNASIGAFGPIELSTDEQIDLSIETNFVAPFRITRALLPHFRARGNGVIVNVSSGLGFAADRARGLYSATKFALEGFSETLALELQPFGVRVAVVEPGATQTSFNDKASLTPGYGPDSPYWNSISAWYDRLGSAVYKNGISDAKVLGDAIFAAATDDTTPLFVAAAPDVRLSARLRGRDDLATYSHRLDQAIEELARA